MKKFKNHPDLCPHFPIIGRDSDYKYGGCWKILEVTMGQITRQCVKCGRIEVSQLTTYNSEMFMNDRRRYDLAKDRDENAVNMIQPIDRHGKFNEDFGKHYGYNPMKIPAPQLQQSQDGTTNDLGSKIAEENIKLQPLKK